MRTETTSKMIVYRIENKEGKGPYQDQSYGPLSKLCWSHNNSNYPDLCQDFYGLVSFDYNFDFVFGFQSRQLYKSWFGGFITLMRSHGFKLSKYEIDPEKIIVGKSGKQIIFRKSDAMKLP